MHRPPVRDRYTSRLVALGGGDREPVLISVGRLVETKNHAALVPVMQRVIDRYPGAILLIVGSGELRERLGELVEQAGLTAHVRLMGARDDVSDLLAVSDLFVFPSLTEGLPVAVLEAAAAGLPMVTYDLPSLGGMVEDGKNGKVVVPVGDSTAFTEATVTVLDDLSAYQESAALMWDELRDRFANAAFVNDELDRIYTSARSAIGLASARRFRRSIGPKPDAR